MAEGDDVKPAGSVGLLGVRHGQVVLYFLFYIIIYGIQTSFTTTIIWMVHTADIRGQVWSMSTISSLISSYIIGFAITELFGGWICKKIGFKWPLVALMVIISAVTLSLSTLTNAYSSGGLMFCRIVQGLCAGLAFTMPIDFISRWIPIQERTVLGTAIYASGRLGEALGFILSYYMTLSSGGWPLVYYEYGFAAIIWAILMAIFGADSPEEYKLKISEAELNYIVQNRGSARPKSKVKIPWIQIFTSMPFWAIIVAQVGATWALSVLSINVPIYVQSYYHVALRNTSAFSIKIIIALISWILSFPISGIAQLLISGRRTTIEQSRKMFNTIGCLIPALCLIYMVVKPSGGEIEGVAIMSIASVASIGTICGSKLNCNDISSNFAPIIFGIATWLALILDMVFNLVCATRMFDNFTFVFLFTVVLLVVTSLFYLKFASGEEQQWDSHEDVSDEEVDLSRSATYTSNDEGKYLLFVKKQ